MTLVVRSGVGGVGEGEETAEVGEEGVGAILVGVAPFVGVDDGL